MQSQNREKRQSRKRKSLEKVLDIKTKETRLSS